MWNVSVHSRTGLNCRLAVGIVLLLALGAAPVLQGLPRGERHENRHEIDVLEDHWHDAMMHRNVAAIDALLADDYMGITGNGTLQSKDETLANLRSGVVRFTSMQFSDRKVRFYGNTALVTSRAEVVGTSPEGDISGSYRYTHVWVRDNKGAWKIVSFEASRIRQHGAHK